MCLPKLSPACFVKRTNVRFGKHRHSLFILKMAAPVTVGTDRKTLPVPGEPSLLGVVLLRSVRRYNFLRGRLVILFAEITHHPVPAHLDAVGKEEPNTG